MRPASSTSMMPPGGVSDSGVSPAASRASELATELWPPARVSTTGLAGAASSRSHRSGRRCSASSSSDQPYPVIHSPPPSCSALRVTRAFSSARFSSPARSTQRSASPLMWMWVSMNPGSTSRPPRSMVRAAR